MLGREGTLRLVCLRDGESRVALAICASAAVIGMAGWLLASTYALLPVGVAVALLSALLWAPERVKPSLLVVGTAVGLSLAATVALEVNEEPAPQSYWPSFAAWLVGLGLVIAVSYSQLFMGLRTSAGTWVRANAAEIGIVAGLTAAAVVVRVVNLTSLPSPFSGDEAAHLLQGLRVSAGRLDNMFASGLQGQPTAYYFGLSGLMSVFGEGVFGARMLGVVLGTATVPAVYVLLRSLFDARVAFLGGGYIVAYHFAVHYSRQDLNNIGDALVLAVVCLFLWRAVTHARPVDYLMAGLVTGLGFYVNVGCRVAVPLIASVWLFTLVMQRDYWRPHLAGMAYCVAGFLVALAPLGLFWYEHPDEFSNRINSVGILQSGWLEEEAERTGRSELGVLLEQAELSFGVFGHYGDRSPHYEAPISLIEIVTLPFFLLGAAVTMRNVLQPRYLILALLFLGVVISGGVLTELPPTSQRFLAAMPPIVAFVALGMHTATNWMGRFISPGVAFGVAVALLAGIVAYNLQYYFDDYAHGEYFSDGNTRIAKRAADYVTALPEETQIYWYGAPLIYTGHPTFAFWTRERETYDVLEDGSVVPERESFNGDSAFLFLAHRQDELQTLSRLCPGGRVESVGTEWRPDMFVSYIAPPGSDCGRFAAEAGAAIEPP